MDGVLPAGSLSALKGMFAECERYRICGAFMPYLGHAGFGQNRVTERVCADQHACLAQIAQLFCVEREIVGKSAWLISAMRSIVSCCTAGA